MTPIAPPEGLLHRLRAGRRFLITSHTSPDGDALGSELGLASLLAEGGRQAILWNADPAPAALRQLPGLDHILVGRDHGPTPEAIASCDAIVLLECPTRERCGLDDLFPPLPLLNIDHHLGNDLYGLENWVDVAAPAVGEMVWRLASILDWKPSARAANLLYLALTSDTGGFRFSNATARAFRAAEEMVAAGAAPEDVAHVLYEQHPPEWIGLLSAILETLQRSHDGAVASVTLTRAAMARVGAGREHTDGLVDVPRAIAGVRAVAFLREVDDDHAKVSLRSRGTVDVEAIARRYGGGGHRNAAGFMAAGRLEAIRAQVDGELARAVAVAGADLAGAPPARPETDVEGRR